MAQSRLSQGALKNGPPRASSNGYMQNFSFGKQCKARIKKLSNSELYEQRTQYKKGPNPIISFKVARLKLCMTFLGFLRFTQVIPSRVFQLPWKGAIALSYAVLKSILLWVPKKIHLNFFTFGSPSHLEKRIGQVRYWICVCFQVTMQLNKEKEGFKKRNFF